SRPQAARPLPASTSTDGSRPRRAPKTPFAWSKLPGQKLFAETSMSDASANKPFAFSQFVPGFDFLRNLASGSAAAGATPAMPSLGSWVAPTLSVEEVDKRIQELKTVQFWLEQNGHALKATIQALEVQKMTLSTLRGMNVQ